MAALTETQRQRARAIAAQAALIAYSKRDSMHYTRDSRRWSGIDERRDSRKGQVPIHSDCSAFTTWCLWNALYYSYGKPDVVNGARWNAGYTGTQMEHGRVIRRVSDMRKGDLVFYGSGSTPTHVAIVVGRRHGAPVVVSHGNEEGPFFLRYDYRRLICVRRYIHKGV